MNEPYLENVLRELHASYVGGMKARMEELTERLEGRGWRVVMYKGGLLMLVLRDQEFLRRSEIVKPFGGAFVFEATFDGHEYHATWTEPLDEATPRFHLETLGV